MPINTKSVPLEFLLENYKGQFKNSNVLCWRVAVSVAARRCACIQYGWVLCFYPNGRFNEAITIGMIEIWNLFLNNATRCPCYTL